MPVDGDITQTSRSRILAAGKSLFSRLGYEQTSTATIAREAGTSESQLVRYFGGKSGLLDAVFNESWGSLNEAISTTIGAAEHGREAILRVLSLVVEAFGRDHDMAFLFLFEGRRIRGNEVSLSKGFLAFYEVVHQLVRRGQEDGSFRTDVNDDTLSSAMLGCAEGMIRDRLIAERLRQPNPFSDDDVRRVFAAVVDGLRG
jgi:AcrR family transcriptional regulator